MASPRVLVVDDDPTFLQFLSRTLKRGGFAVHTANDGCEVPDLVSMRDFDVLVVDLQMPGMNGWEVIRTLRGQERTTPKARKDGPKIVVVSGRSEDETEAFVRRLGADAYLTKPSWGEQILATVRGVLRH